MTVLRSWLDGLLEVSTSSTVYEQVRRNLSRIVVELRDADPSTFDPPVPVAAQSLTFSKVTGWDGTASILSAPQTISFDSGRILLNGQVIADGIKDLSYTLAADMLTIDLEVEKSFPAGGTMRTVSQRLTAQMQF